MINSSLLPWLVRPSDKPDEGEDEDEDEDLLEMALAQCEPKVSSLDTSRFECRAARSWRVEQALFKVQFLLLLTVRHQ